MSSSNHVTGAHAGHVVSKPSPAGAVGIFQAAFDRRSPDDLLAIAHIKRFTERFSADSALREALLAKPADADAAARFLNLPISARAIRPIWDTDFAATVDLDDWPLARLWFDWMADIRLVSETLSADADTGGHSPRFDAWHRRQVARTDSELGKKLGLTLQPVIAFELSRGCSVGCWFCGISAEKFGGHLAYSPENAVFWRDSLQALQGVLGRGMQTGLCYWGTDPIDNPDYARFISDYHDITGWLPPMTTAVPLRDPALTREVLQLAEQRSTHNRFSVLTLRALEQIHAAFSPTDMLRVALVLQMKGSLSPITVSGRALERAARKTPPAFAVPEDGDWTPGTIACVSGFLINMMDRVVRLITPCQSTAANPRGYHVLAEAGFTSAAELADAVAGMIADHMPERVSDAGKLRFRSDLSFQPTDQGFVLRSKAVTHHVKGDAYVTRLGEMIVEGVHATADIVGALIAEGGNIFVLNGTLKRLFDKGMFDIGAMPAAH